MKQLMKSRMFQCRLRKFGRFVWSYSWPARLELLLDFAKVFSGLVGCFWGRLKQLWNLKCLWDAPAQVKGTVTLTVM